MTDAMARLAGSTKKNVHLFSLFPLTKPQGETLGKNDFQYEKTPWRQEAVRIVRLTWLKLVDEIRKTPLHEAHAETLVYIMVGHGLQMNVRKTQPMFIHLANARTQANPSVMHPPLIIETVT